VNLPGDRRDDTLTVSAIAVAAVVITTVAHEAIGHGSACLALGGRTVLLTSVYFDCSVKNVLIAGAGPLGNISAAVLSWLFLRALPAGHPRFRLLLLLTMAFNVFWAAGYLLYSAVLNEGDNAIVARILFGQPDWRWRIGLFVLGLVLYRIGTRATVGEARSFADGQGRARKLLIISFIAGSLTSIVAAAFYAPDRLHAAIQGALEVGGAAIPFLFLARLIKPEDTREAPIMRSSMWISGCAILFVVFVATLGRGLPY
jgi:hypothetical protein